jgi:NAD(P)-dependent dehydrogenase (short-subunit alcohol dehydrogenase family)
MGYCAFEADLSGRVALVTGANSGMGKETARELTRMGAEVILGCRSKERGEAAANEIIETTGRNGVAVMGSTSPHWPRCGPLLASLMSGFRSWMCS